jgi:hypothetical protein
MIVVVVVVVVVIVVVVAVIVFALVVTLWSLIINYRSPKWLCKMAIADRPAVSVLKILGPIDTP